MPQAPGLLPAHPASPCWPGCVSILDVLQLRAQLQGSGSRLHAASPLQPRSGRHEAGGAESAMAALEASDPQPWFITGPWIIFVM